MFGAVGTKIIGSDVREVSGSGTEIGPYRIATKDINVHVIRVSDHPGAIYNVDGIPMLESLKPQQQFTIMVETAEMMRRDELVYVQFARLRKFPSAGAVLLTINIDRYGNPLPVAQTPRILQYLGIALIVIAALLVLSSEIKRRKSNV